MDVIIIEQKFMVESSEGDGINRTIQYAKFRTDKPATPGHSAEILDMNAPMEWADKFEEMPLVAYPECDTFLKHFQR